MAAPHHGWTVDEADVKRAIAAYIEADEARAPGEDMPPIYVEVRRPHRKDQP